MCPLKAKLVFFSDCWEVMFMLWGSLTLRSLIFSSKTFYLLQENMIIMIFVHLYNPISHLFQDHINGILPYQF